MKHFHRKNVITGIILSCVAGFRNIEQAVGTDTPDASSKSKTLW